MGNSRIEIIMQTIATAHVEALRALLHAAILLALVSAGAGLLVILPRITTGKVVEAILFAGYVLGGGLFLTAVGKLFRLVIEGASNGDL